MRPPDPLALDRLSPQPVAPQWMASPRRVAQNHAQIPVLLTEPNHCGTLAAARELGRRGVWVSTIGPSRLGLASSSRHVGKHWRCAPEAIHPARIDWLEEYGRRHPGTILYPTSDTMAWLQALHAPALERSFRTYSPDIEAMEAVLEKRRLYDVCDAVRIATPVTHFAESREDIEAVAKSARFPLLLKQRTQVFSRSKTKGLVVERPEALVGTYESFVARNQHAPEVQCRMPFASWPMMQEFHPDAFKKTYLVSGFVNRDHTACVAQAAVKVLQYPRTLGIALCMEEAPLDAALAARILTLCKLTGFYGVFQIEFILDGDRKLLIDFNPRYYHYMAYDIARGLPLPWYAQLGACGDEAALARELAAAREPRAGPALAFSYRLQLAEMLWAQQLAGTMSRDEAGRWRRWHRAHRGHLVDAVADRDDRWPEIIAGVLNWSSHARHPRAFINRIALHRESA